MLWTLYRLLILEVGKVLILVTICLVALLSFVVAIPPLADGLLTPTMLIRFVLFTAPTMTPIVLPFAAAFAATMVFSRMAGDLEILACAASGISYRAILAPLLVLAMLLAVAVFLINHWAAPLYFARAEQMIQRDLARIIVKQVNAGQAVDQIDGVVFRADQARTETPPVSSDPRGVAPQQWIILEDVALGDLDGRGRLRGDRTAERADLLVYRIDGATYLTARLENVMHFDEGRGELAYAEVLTVPAIRMPGDLLDEPQFLSAGELRELAREPIRYSKVRDRRRQLAVEVARHHLLDAIVTELAAPESRGFTLHAPDEQVYRINAPAWRRGPGHLELLATDQEPVRIAQQAGGIVHRRVEAQRVMLEARAELDAQMRVEIEAGDALLYDTRDVTRSTEHRSVELPAAWWTRSILDPLVDDTRLDALRAAAAAPSLAADPLVADAARRLDNTIGRLRREVLAQFHARAAYAVCALLAPLLGALMALANPGRYALSVFVVSFLLVLIAMFAVRGGDNVLGDQTLPAAAGVAVIWAGAVGLLLLLAVLYARVART